MDWLAPPSSPLHELLEPGEREVLLHGAEGRLVVVTDRAVYGVLAPTSSASPGLGRAVMRGLFSATARAAPRVRHGCQSWRSAVGEAVSRVGLEMIESVSVRCEATDVQYVLSSYHDGGHKLDAAHECLRKKCALLPVEHVLSPTSVSA